MKLDHTWESWVEELLSILWSYQTTPQEGTSMPPFHLVHGGVVVSTEIGMAFARVSAYDEDNTEKHSLDLDLVEETRDRTVAWLRVFR